MFGDPFFTRLKRTPKHITILWFSSPCLGILFSRLTPTSRRKPGTCFRPHVWGFFFHTYHGAVGRWKGFPVFVPMFGDSFFTRQCGKGYQAGKGCFRPHVWGFFFHKKQLDAIMALLAKFSSPCLGILFSQAHS